MGFPRVSATLAGHPPATLAARTFRTWRKNDRKRPAFGPPRLVRGDYCTRASDRQGRGRKTRSRRSEPPPAFGDFHEQLAGFAFGRGRYRSRGPHGHAMQPGADRSTAGEPPGAANENEERG